MRSLSKSKNNTYDIIVVGGGASGMMAAGIAAQNDSRVLLLEKNRNLGEKLKITGGGRCNITNAEFDTRTLLKYYGNGEQFLYSAFSQFDVKNTFEFFESHGLPLVVQAGKRAFPKTERAIDVLRTLETFLKRGKVTVQTDSAVLSIKSEKGKIVSVTTKHGVHTASNYILATGGQSHPETGSTGDGFKWLRDLGHTVIVPTPSIVPLAVKDKWVKSLAGTTLTDARITFFVDGKKKFKKEGRILCTHFGLSGPTILNSARLVDDLLHEGIVTATIDLFPGVDQGDVEKKILSVFDANKNKMLKNIFKEVVPVGTKDAILSLVPTIDSDKKVHSITKDERRMLAQLLKALPVTIIGLMGFDRAVVADGGIVLDEIHTKTMQSKLFSNLYITGDLLHINRPTGGQSLQLCWTTGFVAGTHASKK